ncbi:MAG: FecR domain-containing protein [Cyanobacteria bacterium J06639_14]
MAARADVPLIRADVESIENNVEVILQGQTARQASLSDWLGLGDALRTSSASRAELRFNDGSLARIGERATFRFAPDTRNFRLSNGTVLLLIPPGNGPSRIQTPSAITGVQGTALVVRHIPFDGATDPSLIDNWNTELPSTWPYGCDPNAQLMETGNSENSAPSSLTECVSLTGFDNEAIQEYPGRTIVMVLTNNPVGPVEVTTSEGMTETLTAGHMAVIEGDAIQVLEFDLALFYETSPLVEGLHLDNPDFEGSGLPTDPVRQETLDGLAAQSDFDGGYLLNPEVLSSQAELLPSSSLVVFQETSEPVSQNTAVSSNKPIGSMSTLLTNRRLITDAVPSGVNTGTVTTTASNSPNGSASMHGAKKPSTNSAAGGGTGSTGSGSFSSSSPPSTPNSGSSSTPPPSSTPNSGSSSTPPPSTQEPVDSSTPPENPPTTPSNTPGKPGPTGTPPGDSAPNPAPETPPGSSAQDPIAGPEIDPAPVEPAPVDQGPVVDPTPVEPTPVDQGPVIDPTGQDTNPTIDPGPVDQGPTIDPGPVDQGPTIDPGPVDQGPTIDPGPVDQGPTIDPGPVDQGPTIDPGPVDQGPTIDPGPVDQGPTIDPGPVDQGPTIDPGPVDQGPVIDPTGQDTNPVIDPTGQDTNPVIDPTGQDTNPVIDPTGQDTNPVDPQPDVNIDPFLESDPQLPEDDHVLELNEDTTQFVIEEDAGGQEGM